MGEAEERWNRVNELFHATVPLPPADRGAFLSSQCGADAALRAEVESLLAMHRGDEGHTAALRPGSRVGDYEVTGFIASGAMGDVYRARDTRLGREVALKVLPAAVVSNPDRRARFEREARTLASLTHPHIATIYGVEEADGISALALELVDGETLAHRIARGRLPVDEALRIARQIAQALETAHEHVPAEAARGSAAARRAAHRAGCVAADAGRSARSGAIAAPDCGRCRIGAPVCVVSAN